MRARSMVLVAAVAVAGVMITGQPGQAALIDFEDGTEGSAIGAFYAALGVTFSNGEWDDFESPDEETVGAGELKLVGLNNDYDPGPADPIVATFSSPMTSVHIHGLNVGENGARIDAYDAVVGGSLVDFDQAFGIGFGVDNHPLLNVTGAGIRRIELYQPFFTLNEGLLFDNLRFVPEPATLSLLALGSLALVRRRRHA